MNAMRAFAARNQASAGAGGELVSPSRDRGFYPSPAMLRRTPLSLQRVLPSLHRVDSCACSHRAPIQRALRPHALQRVRSTARSAATEPISSMSRTRALERERRARERRAVREQRRERNRSQGVERMGRNRQRALARQRTRGRNRSRKRALQWARLARQRRAARRASRSPVRGMQRFPLFHAAGPRVRVQARRTFNSVSELRSYVDNRPQRSAGKADASPRHRRRLQKRISRGRRARSRRL